MKVNGNVVELTNKEKEILDKASSIIGELYDMISPELVLTITFEDGDEECLDDSDLEGIGDIEYLIQPNSTITITSVYD